RHEELSSLSPDKSAARSGPTKPVWTWQARFISTANPRRCQTWETSVTVNPLVVSSSMDLPRSGRLPAIGDVAAHHRVLLGFPISHNGDLHRVRRLHGSCCLDRSW